MCLLKYSGRVVAYPDITPFWGLSGLPVIRPPPGQRIGNTFPFQIGLLISALAVYQK